MSDVVENCPSLYVISFGLNEMKIYAVEGKWQGFEENEQGHQIMNLVNIFFPRSKENWLDAKINPLSNTSTYLLLHRIPTQKQPDAKKTVDMKK